MKTHRLTAVQRLKRLRAFAWSHVLEKVASGAPVYYRAPMDARARRVEAFVKGKRLRIKPFGYWRRGERPFDPFFANADHISRISFGEKS